MWDINFNIPSWRKMYQEYCAFWRLHHCWTINCHFSRHRYRFAVSLSLKDEILSSSRHIYLRCYFKSYRIENKGRAIVYFFGKNWLNLQEKRVESSWVNSNRNKSQRKRRINKLERIQFVVYYFTRRIRQISENPIVLSISLLTGKIRSRRTLPQWTVTSKYNVNCVQII